MRSVALFSVVLILGGCSLILTEHSGATDAGPSDGDAGTDAADGGPVTASCGKTTLLRDEFDAPGLNPTHWDAAPASRVTQGAGKLNFSVPANTSASLVGAVAHDLHESELVFEVASFPVDGELRVDLAMTIDGAYTTVQLVFATLPGGDGTITAYVGVVAYPISNTNPTDTIWRFSRTGLDLKIESRSSDEGFLERTSFNPNIDLSRVTLNFRLTSTVGAAAAIESVNGGNTSPEVYCPASSLTDDFATEDVLDHWNEPAPNCTLSSGGVGIVESTGDIYCRFLAASGYALDAAGVTVSLVNLGAVVGEAGLRIVGDLSADNGVEIRLLGGVTLRVKTPSETFTSEALPMATTSLKLRAYVRDLGTPMVVLNYVASGGQLVELSTFPFEQMPSPPLRIELFVDGVSGGVRGYAEFADLGGP